MIWRPIPIFLAQLAVIFIVCLLVKQQYIFNRKCASVLVSALDAVLTSTCCSCTLIACVTEGRLVNLQCCMLAKSDTATVTAGMICLH